MAELLILVYEAPTVDGIRERGRETGGHWHVEDVRSSVLGFAGVYYVLNGDPESAVSEWAEAGDRFDVNRAISMAIDLLADPATDDLATLLGLPRDPGTVLAEALSTYIDS